MELGDLIVHIRDRETVHYYTDVLVGITLEAKLQVEEVFELLEKHLTPKILGEAAYNVSGVDLFNLVIEWLHLHDEEGDKFIELMLGYLEPFYNPQEEDEEGDNVDIQS